MFKKIIYSILFTSIFMAFVCQAELRTLAKRSNIRVQSDDGLAKVVTLPAGTVITFEKEDYLNAKKLTYAPGKKTKFVGNIRVKSIPYTHNLKPSEIGTLANFMEMDEPLYMSERIVKESKALGTQQEFVRTLEKGSIIYRDTGELQELESDDIKLLKEKVLYSPECIGNVDLPVDITDLPFIPIAERIYGMAVMKYSQSSEVDKMIRYAKRNLTEPGGKLGKCFKAVKMAMLNAGFLPFYLDGLSAALAKDSLTEVESRLDELKAEGKVSSSAKVTNYINLMDDDSPYKGLIKSPCDAPKGAILVYEGGVPVTTPYKSCSKLTGKKKARCNLLNRSRHGHIEIKTGTVGNCAAISDYYDADSRTNGSENGLSNGLKGPHRRTLIGVMIKPDME